MKTKTTSRKAWQELLASGKLRGYYRTLMGALSDIGPATSAEIIDYAGHRLDLPHAANRNLHRARITELQARGLLVESTQRKCKITGHLAIVWRYSGRAKPLDAKRGHRVDGAAWKVLALEAIEALEYDATGDAPDLRERAKQLG